MLKKNKSKQINVRLTPQMHADLQKLAEASRWETAQAARIAIEEFIERHVQTAKVAADRRGAAA
jgi:predicted transcriptional regulator